METLELLRSYSSVVSDLAPDARFFGKLMDAVDGYCLAMATNLFEEPVEVAEMRDYIGTEEFRTRLPKGDRDASKGFSGGQNQAIFKIPGGG
jgi:hypothetical protein